MKKIMVLAMACIGLSGCLSDEKAFGNAAGYGRSYHSPLKVEMPANAPSITQQFRRIKGNEHYGLDVHAEIGTPVIAAAGGIVTKSRLSPPYGNLIEIRHPADAAGVVSSTRYFHLQRRMVAVGDEVARGAQIGTLGATGFLSGGFPHLHFEALEGGSSGVRNARDPNLYWVDGVGQVTCFGPEHAGLTDAGLVLTYPVVCR